jgi:hypothetical protein
LLQHLCQQQALQAQAIQLQREVLNEVRLMRGPAVPPVAQPEPPAGPPPWILLARSAIRPTELRSQVPPAMKTTWSKSGGSGAAFPQMPVPKTPPGPPPVKLAASSSQSQGHSSRSRPLVPQPPADPPPPSALSNRTTPKQKEKWYSTRPDGSTRSKKIKRGDGHD